VRQLVTVTAASHTTTYATLRAYRVSGGRRVLVLGPWTARVGYDGVALPGGKREGDGKTPSGAFGVSFFFGAQPKLDFSFPFRHAYNVDYWDDDPASARYNEWVNASRHDPGASPEPMHNVPAYDYAAVIAYNTARAPGLGSAIFLHAGLSSPTAGCVSLPRPRRRGVLPALMATAERFRGSEYVQRARVRRRAVRGSGRTRSSPSAGPLCLRRRRGFADKSVCLLVCAGAAAVQGAGEGGLGVLCGHAEGDQLGGRLGNCE
jgi:L,D-peptidoglycan transpeptidase YkuD (ErfK/YbiS/YcfS/YnhG family)